ncbi:DUF4236 domain-containing protein [Acinetobacter brisouii]|uniref:DUF4236 domain-containing protein n=1 Tax=Acinetobacter brisouii TaxID=396323 RepID=UPI0005F8040A|nr:DUF4236 domain-containing protein [Acinetobacter brisouii]KJV38198.1 hypothetical protein VH98_10090 [Acinetobacter brisouii]
MGLNFRKSFKIAPGVRLNVGKKGLSSVSLGGKGVKINVGKKGTRTTLSAPGTGLSYSSYKPHNKNNTNSPRPDYSDPDNLMGYSKSEWIIRGIVGFIFVVVFIWLIS